MSLLLTRVLGWLSAVLVGDVLRVRRGQVERSMELAGVPDPAKTARRMYLALGRGLWELVAMAVVPGSRCLERVRLDSPLLDQLEGQPFVAAVAHTGNFDLVGCAFAQRFPLWVVTKHFKVGILDGFWQAARQRRGVRLLEQGRVLTLAPGALRQGGVVAMVIDQAPERERGAVRLSFMGQAAWVDLAPALIALRARVPLVGMFPLRRPDGSHTLVVTRVLEPPKHVSRSWAIDAMMLLTQDLEQLVRTHPEQWLWLHRRWKDAPRLLPKVSPA